jgi:glycosyltransferase involved in cell wall biosynthesis
MEVMKIDRMKMSTRTGETQIALFLPCLCVGGAERVFVHLSKGFAQQGFVVDMVLAQAEGPYLPQVPTRVRCIGLGRRQVLHSLPRLVQYLREVKPSVLLSALDHANVVALLARQWARVPTKVVVSIHNTMSVATRHSRHSRERLIPVLARWLYPKAYKVVAVSQGVAADTARFYRLPLDKVEFIYNPVVTPELISLSMQPVEHPWFSPGEPSVILGVGRLTAQKDFPTLIRAFAHVRQHRDTRLVILGEGEERTRLEQLVASLGLRNCVDFPGFVDNPYSWMRRAAVFGLSSRWEGLGVVLVEAMACGTPVVSTDCPSGPREILEDGKWGKLVPVGDPDKLAEAIIDTLDNPPAYDPAVRAADFSVERAVEGYLNALGL